MFFFFFFLKIEQFRTNRIVRIHIKSPPGKIVNFFCEIRWLTQSYTILEYSTSEDIPFMCVRRRERGDEKERRNE